MIFFKKAHTEKIRITIGNISKMQSEKLRSNNINNYNKNNLNKKITNFTQREYTIEDFEKLYSNNEWQNNE